MRLPNQGRSIWALATLVRKVDVIGSNLARVGYTASGTLCARHAKADTFRAAGDKDGLVDGTESLDEGDGYSCMFESKN